MSGVADLFGQKVSEISKKEFWIKFHEKIYETLFYFIICLKKIILSQNIIRKLFRGDLRKLQTTLTMSITKN